jgi:inorganic pyrophosphatase
MSGASAASGDEVIEIVVETPRGSQNKMKWDEAAGRFRLSHVLPTGMSFPFDFGFVPGTRADDGDPVDVLLLTDAGLPMGCLVEARLVGVLEVEQREKDGEKVRNDRLIGVAQESKTHARIHDIADLSPELLTEIEAFFGQYNRLDGKSLQVLGRHGPGPARAIVKRARRKVA